VTFFPDGTSEPTVVDLTAAPHLYRITVDETTSRVVITAGRTPR